MTYPLVRDLAAEGFGVRLACGVLGFSAQAYYAWVRDPVSDRDWHDAHVIDALIDAHRDDPAFGYRLLADELERAGIAVGERRCGGCAPSSGCSRPRCAGPPSQAPRPAVHDDHLRRDFTAAAPNLEVVTDITEHPPQARARCTAARSRTCSPTGSSATQSPSG